MPFSLARRHCLVVFEHSASNTSLLREDFLINKSSAISVAWVDYIVLARVMTDLLNFSFPLISQIIFLSHARLYCSEENLLRGFPCWDGNKRSFEFYYCIQLWFFSSNPSISLSDFILLSHFIFSTQSNFHFRFNALRSLLLFNRIHRNCSAD